MMSNRVLFRAATLVAAASLTLLIAPVAARAQSGSAGGSIGNDNRSLSGARPAEPEQAARRSRQEATAPRRAARHSGGGSGNFDGAWMVVSTGITCAGTSTGAVVVTSGRIIGEGVSGTVSPNGAARSVGNYNGVTVISTGRVSGRSGSGTFKRSDGCIGRWMASKQ